MGKIKNLELITDLSDKSRKKIEERNDLLIKNEGACFVVDEVTNCSVQVAVKNINGKRTGKYELLKQTYAVFSENLPSDYRILIKL